MTIERILTQREREREMQLENLSLGAGDDDEQSRQKFIKPIKTYLFKRGAQFGPKPKKLYAFCFKDLHLFFLLMLPRKRLRVYAFKLSDFSSD